MVAEGLQLSQMICTVVVVALWDPKRTANANALCAEMARNNMGCTLFPAVRGSMALEHKAAYSHLVPPRHPLWNTAGKAGAFLSKASLLQNITRGKGPCLCNATLVLEDDAKLLPGFFEKTGVALRNPPPEGWDLITLQGAPKLHDPRHPYYWLCRTGSYSGGQLTYMRRLAHICPLFSRDTANLWSRRGASKAASHLPLGQEHVAFDLWIGAMHKQGSLDIYMAQSPLVMANKALKSQIHRETIAGSQHPWARRHREIPGGLGAREN